MLKISIPFRKYVLRMKENRFLARMSYHHSIRNKLAYTFLLNAMLFISCVGLAFFSLNHFMHDMRFVKGIG